MSSNCLKKPTTINLYRENQLNSGESCGLVGASSDVNSICEMTPQSASRNVTIVNPQGLHARPADLFVKLANQFESAIEVIKNGERVDGKSILSVLTLAAEQGTELTIEATGDDADVAIIALTGLVDNGFVADRPVEDDGINPR